MAAFQPELPGGLGKRDSWEEHQRNSQGLPAQPTRPAWPLARVLGANLPGQRCPRRTSLQLSRQEQGLLHGKS